MQNKICDNCGEEWEESFFCPVCSNTMKIVESEEPKLIWYGDDTEFKIKEIEVSTGDICYNCCNCNLK